MDPSSLSPGTEVGRWRVVSQRGYGAFGTVYRVEESEHPEAGPRALKLALFPQDPRFAREAELLSRIRSPHVPRLHERGGSWVTGGNAFPYLVVDWVEGASLYEWGFHQQRTSRQVLRVLGQVARALAATHAVSGVHRDVKGENVLVRLEDTTALLVDFGAGTFRGAAALTREPVPPGTREYRSPEAVRFLSQWGQSPISAARYEAGPADDVYALGVTAYHLVTRLYPPVVKAVGDGKRLLPAERVPPGALVTVCPELSEFICRMLSDEPSARGSAAELAQALEDAAETAEAEADWIILPCKTHAPAKRMARRESRHPPPSRRYGRAAAFVTGALVAGAGGTFLGQHWEQVSALAQHAWAEARRTVGLADGADSMAASAETPSTSNRGFALDMPKKPLDDQRRPPCAKPAVEIHRGCWMPLIDVSPPCGDSAYEWNNKCYWPLLGASRPATSEPPE